MKVKADVVFDRVMMSIGFACIAIGVWAAGDYMRLW